MPNPKVSVYAIVRIDKYFSDVQHWVAVQAVLPTLEEAKAEVERLNATRDPERVVYVWRATRFYPEGRKSSSGGSSAASGSDPVDR
jgi:hypothetical protein